jgi:hypothetical protein
LFCVVLLRGDAPCFALLRYGYGERGLLGGDARGFALLCVDYCRCEALSGYVRCGAALRVFRL